MTKSSGWLRHWCLKIIAYMRAMESMPMIFQTSTLNYDERFPVYSEAILGKCKASEVRTKFAEYVEKFVQKRGWKAIWSCADASGVDIELNENLNVLVEVVNVFPQNLSSEVNLCVPVVSNPSITFQEAQSLIRQQDNCIPLTELSPVFDESGDLDQTALALEHVRDWDLDADEDFCYVDRNLENRLRLYYDIMQNNLCQEFIKKYNATLNECKQKSIHLQELRKNMSASDSEQELDTSDVFMLAQKTHEFESIVRSLQTMEDPQMRYLLASVNSKTQDEKGQIRTYPVTMIVAEKLMAKMTKSLSDETVIEHFTSLEKAVECINKEDSIVLYPGNYNVGSLVFEHSLAVEGNGDVTVECDEEDDSFLTTRSPSTQFTNIKFIHVSSNSYLLVVEEGQAVLRNCEFRCTADGIVVRQGAQLIMENCKLYGSMEVAVTIERNSAVQILKCEICNKDIGRETVAIKIISSGSHPANVAITESRISASRCIDVVDDKDIKNIKPSIDNGVRLKLEKNVFDCGEVP
ncbi:SHC SH2 domain-binding protein 1 homolog B-like isoform X2 [Dendronephthya gigantea]|uniref:SHC SH2 domain-binding protein 1 homolog B-like isoform X2 n=1 Tax=Dendronephthya gigantea TaxID=151771 RepID=UPI00106C7ED6|nr:SHC SH2 domain-binding protein 1 homolog B-like isoform X2 [Dendronephthya gigantea]